MLTKKEQEEMLSQIQKNTQAIEFLAQEIKNLATRMEDSNINLATRMADSNKNLGDRIESVNNNLADRLVSVNHNLVTSIETVNNNLADKIEATNKSLQAAIDTNSDRLTSIDNKMGLRANLFIAAFLTLITGIALAAINYYVNHII